MRIAVVVDRLEVGGVEKVAIQQVAALRSGGHDATLVLLRGRGAGFSAFREELAAIPVVVLEERLPRLARMSLPIPGFTFLQTFHFTYPLAARALVRAGEFDCLLAHGTYTCLTALAVQRARGIPTAAFVWDPTYHVLSGPAYGGKAVGSLGPLLLPVARRFDSWLMRSAPLVVLGGTVYERYALEAGAQRVLVSYPAVSPSAEPLGLDARRPEMLAATAWKHGKDPERLLPLLERAPGMRLVLAGEWLDQRLRDDLEREARARGLSERLEVTGRLSEAELAGRYARATFVVQAWPSPGFGLSPLEAAAAGTTFVVPRGQGSAEVFREGIDGLFFDLDDDAALHAAVDALSGDPARAVWMGRNAWGWVQERHLWAARSSELAAALAETASGAIDGRFRPGAAEGEDEDVRR
jgi:glycosyltransferase involved in cell wall biosynthesis